MFGKATITAAVAAIFVPTIAFADGGTVSGAAGGAATGAIVGGPVGAAVGGVAGAALGTIMDPPAPEVREVVVQQEVPSVQVQKEIVVGQPLPETVVLRPVPGYTQYTYAVVNNQRVIVDPGTRQVIQIVN
ncbi:hypothetical protein GCM10007276_34860 [Agaricicola taiwanensis]|uniref:DUF1236 domain-containing protein n=1 Tax=Agaricicola taiwanensis TaxID=591372 RepID=A0A8J2YN99_9RHOB|nr:DUF1236 domain-containing protein [Agaricicola taiwanensis]GGE54924.1 hypothetical protein GCM10007276_34860 [Agaricicola taiwanensis]